MTDLMKAWLASAEMDLGHSRKLKGACPVGERDALV